MSLNRLEHTHNDGSVPDIHPSIQSGEEAMNKGSVLQPCRPSLKCSYPTMLSELSRSSSHTPLLTSTALATEGGRRRRRRLALGRNPSIPPYDTLTLASITSQLPPPFCCATSPKAFSSQRRLSPNKLAALIEVLHFRVRRSPMVLITGQVGTLLCLYP